MLVAVSRLPRRQREILALRFYLDMPENEIAATLKVSRGTVSSTVSRALATLARQLGEDYPDGLAISADGAKLVSRCSYPARWTTRGCC